MNGGVDGIINTHLSSFTPTKYIQEDVKHIINKEYMGELPVGQSVILPTCHPKHKILIYTPTMRVAENVANSINAYLAFRGALLLMRKNNISSAAISLLCSGAGGMSIQQSCNQMLEAYKSVMDGHLIDKDWKYYHSNHRHLHNLGKS